MWLRATFAVHLVALANSVAANCAYGTSAFPRLPDVPVSTFGYDSLSGPLNWYGLNESANELCDIGTTQSPIVINSAIQQVSASTLEWTVPAYPYGAEFENLGTNVEVVVNGSLRDMNSGKEFKLAQFHFHTPAEHRIDDEFYPMEMHWVFESADNDYAVIAFVVELCERRGCGDTVLDSVFQAIDEISVPGEAVTTGPLHFRELISKFKNHTVWRYSGSLTTPPCTEQVDWLISAHTLSIDLPTWLSVKKVIKFNARYTQDTLGAINLLQNAADELSST